MSDAPVVIEARGIQKTFRIPEQRIDSLRSAPRIRSPASRTASTTRCATSASTSAEGEFFGIVGRNGSGKSSLLKILASIYRADGGRVRDRRPAWRRSSSSASASTTS